MIPRISTGIDIVSITRMQESIERTGDAFLRRIFTPEEVAYCQPKKRSYEHFAARFAAKEACIKALGGRHGILGFKDIEVVREPNGAPNIQIAPEKYERLDLPASTSITVSLAHERLFAIAVVVITHGGS